MTEALQRLVTAMAGYWIGDELLTQPGGGIVPSAGYLTVRPILRGAGMTSDYEQDGGPAAHTVILPGAAQHTVAMHWYTDSGAAHSFEGTVETGRLTVSRAEDGMTHRLIQDVDGGLLASRYELVMPDGKAMTLVSATYARQDSAEA